MRSRQRNLQQIHFSVCLDSMRCNCLLTCRRCRSYPEILKIYVENLASILTGADPGELQDQLDERLQALTEGEIDHASEAFLSLWRNLTHGGGGEPARRIRFDIVRFPSFQETTDPDLIIHTEPGTPHRIAAKECPNQIHQTGIVLRPRVFGKTRRFRKMAGAGLHLQRRP